MDREEQLEQKIITVGERWQARVAARLKQRTAGQQWLRFTEAVQQRRQGATTRTLLAAAIAERQQPQRLTVGDGPAAGPWPPSTPVSASLQNFGNPAQSALSSELAAEELVETRPGAAVLRRSSPPDELPAWSAPPTIVSAHTAPVHLHQGGDRLGVTQPAPGRVATLARTRTAPLGPQATAQSPWPSAGERLPVRTQQILEQALHMRLPRVQLHVGVAADAVARRLQADAVTLGDHIFFRAGKYDPGSATGIGLLGHELTHIAQNRLAEAGLSGPQIGGNPRVQEEVALQNEQQIVAHLTGPPEAASLSNMGGSIPVVAANSRGPVAMGAAARPQTAESDRHVAAPAPTMGEQALSPRQLQQIKDAVYRDLLERIRTEFERGG